MATEEKVVADHFVEAASTIAETEADFTEAVDAVADESEPDAATSESETSFASNVGAEIYEIFVEEIHEILDNFKVWIPQWVNERENTELLREIRRAYHTCKGSGRMVGGLALGDYAWAHEDLLNQVLDGQLPRNDYLVAILQQSLAYLDEHQHFFLNAEQIDEQGRQEIQRVEAFIADPEQPVEVGTKVAAPAEETWAEETETGHDGADDATIVDEPLPEGEEKTPAKKASVDSPPEPTQSPAQVDELEEQRIVWAMFMEELPDQLLSLDQQMQKLMEHPEQDETLKELERELHTLKGSSRMAQLSDIGDLAHQAEELLEQVRRERGRVISDTELGELQWRIDQISLLAEKYAASDMPAGADEVTESGAGADAEKVAEEPVETVAVSTPSIPEPSVAAADTVYQSYLEQVLAEQAGTLPDLSVLKDIDAFSEEKRVTTDSPATPLSVGEQEQIRLSAAYVDQMINNANVLNVQQNTLRERVALMAEDVGEFGRTTARLKQLLRSLELETETRIHAGYRQHAEQKYRAGFDPLEMDEYSEIQRLSRALAESLNDLVNIEGDLSLQLRAIDQFAHESLQTGRELHQGLLNTRLVEVAVIVPRLRRIMRQISSEFGRVVSFEVDGEGLKLDRHLLQQITAPIEHILRNAVFHGIEPPEERLAQGKARDGGVLLEVSREDTEVVIRISDDGRGLDKEKIQRKAVESGLIGAQDKLSDQDIYKLVLHSGFTTVDEANQVAGRGVGMDVVNSEIKALGGSLLIESVPGAGCEFTLRLPFTMVANPVLFVEIQKQQYALPLSGIQGLTRLSTAVIQQHLMNKEAPLMRNGQSYALHYPGAALGYAMQPELRDGDMHVVIFMRIGEYHIAWLVDAINGRRDVVLQSLGALFKTCRFYSAATVTSDGEVVMVPDMRELAGRVILQSGRTDSTISTDLQGNSPQSVQHEHPHILVVDDSVTVRKVTEKFLLNKNFVVETARDGLEALEKLGSFEADLMLLDIEMPRMDGFEVLSAVRMEPRWQHLPIIMISSRTAEKHLDHARALGATNFLGKPYQNAVLLEYIDQHLLQAQQQHPAENAQISEEFAV
ncbi:MAG: hypothetical protein CSA79_01460 [Thiothrix nivea]|nr:MAG: hypothetical protein CSA79_01460 [Thiothrix nivea]